MVILMFHFKVYSIIFRIRESILDTEDGIKLGNTETTDLVSLIGSSERSRNNNIESSLNESS